MKTQAERDEDARTGEARLTLTHLRWALTDLHDADRKGHALDIAVALTAIRDLVDAYERLSGDLLAGADGTL